MEALQRLEQKIAPLVSLIKDLKMQNEALKTEIEQIKSENQDLKAENARLAEENDQLAATLETRELHEKNSKDETKLVVDDLIKSIDALVGQEHQQ